MRRERKESVIAMCDHLVNGYKKESGGRLEVRIVCAEWRSESIYFWVYMSGCML